MADWAKIAIKTGLIAVGMVAIWALLTGVAIPSVTFSADMINGIKTARAILTYWIPYFDTLLVLALGIAAFDIGTFVFKVAMLATKWVMKVNE